MELGSFTCQNSVTFFSIFLTLFLTYLARVSALHPGRVVSLKYKHSDLSLHDLPHDIHRRILRGRATSKLHGHILTKGYYYTDIVLGTPGKKFSVIIDTGSSMTYVPCSTCTRCGNHDDTPYSPLMSKTYSQVKCGSEACLTNECDGNKQCTYSRFYQEKSSSLGIIVSDFVSLGANATNRLSRISFGCETSESGEIFTQTADGIMGLGRGRTSIINQLVNEKVIDDSFSLCFGGMSHGEGALIFGSHPLPKETVFVPIIPQRSPGFYNVKIEGINVEGVPLTIPPGVFDSGFGTIFDSGTTFTYLPESIFDQFYEMVFAGIKVDAIQTLPPDPKFSSDICFASKNESYGRFLLLDDFPQVDFVFSSGATYKLSPENYLFQHYTHVGAFCLGFLPSQDPGTLLGGIMVRNTLVNYDRQNNRIGLYKTNCRNISALIT